MTLSRVMNNELTKLFHEFKDSDMTDIELIKRLRKEEDEKSSLLFYIFLERLLKIAYEEGFVIVSKGLLKQYFKSHLKEEKSQAYYGSADDKKDIIEIRDGIEVKKDLFIKMLEALSLTKTMEAYVSCLVENINDDDKDRIECDGKEEIIELMFNEFDEKLSHKPKIIKV